jgi:hypothetical protein
MGVRAGIPEEADIDKLIKFAKDYILLMCVNVAEVND